TAADCAGDGGDGGDDFVGGRGGRVDVRAGCFQRNVRAGVAEDAGYVELVGGAAGAGELVERGVVDAAGVGSRFLPEADHPDAHAGRRELRRLRDRVAAAGLVAVGDEDDRLRLRGSRLNGGFGGGERGGDRVGGAERGRRGIDGRRHGRRCVEGERDHDLAVVTGLVRRGGAAETIGERKAAVACRRKELDAEAG